jgi:hypothetical protein
MANTFLSNNLKFHKTLPLAEGFMLIMKNILKIILFVLTITSCKAQAVVDLITFNRGNYDRNYF